jgi:hypothetical protein
MFAASLSSILRAFSAGHVKAKELYDEGIRTLDDMRKSGRWPVDFKYHDDMQIKWVIFFCGVYAKFTAPFFIGCRERKLKASATLSACSWIASSLVHIPLSVEGEHLSC